MAKKSSFGFWTHLVVFTLKAVEMAKKSSFGFWTHLVVFTLKAVEMANKLKEHVMEKLDRDTWGDKEMEIIGQLKMRYFTPREVANIMCFPKSFSKFIVSYLSHMRTAFKQFLPFANLFSTVFNKENKIIKIYHI